MRFYRGSLKLMLVINCTIVMKNITEDEVELLWRAWLKNHPNTGCNWLGKWAWHVCKRKEFIAQLERDGYRIVV